MFSESKELLHEFFCKAGVLLETETLEDLPLRFVPVTRRQAKQLQDAMAAFGNGEEAALPYPLNPEAEPEPRGTKRQNTTGSGQNTTTTQQKSTGTQQNTTAGSPKASAVTANAKKDPNWFWNIVITVPRKGMKKSDYDKEPDTIRGLYEQMKAGDDGAQKRLWGLVHHWDAVPHEFKGKTYPPSDADILCREALDAFADYEERHPHAAEEDDLPM